VSAARPGLSLRGRVRLAAPTTAPVGDFGGPASREGDLAPVFGVRSRERHDALVFRAGSLPRIPVTTAKLEQAALDFDFVATHRGVLHVLRAPRRMGTTASPRRLALAVAVPLALGPALARADPPSLPPTATDDGAGEAYIDDRASSDGPARATESAADSAERSPITAPRPAGDDALALTGESLWNGIVGHDVRLEVRTPEGNVFVEGELVAQSNDQLALAMGESGAVASVPKADVVGILVDPAPGGGTAGIPGNTGNGLLIGGGFMVGVGVPLLALGAAFGGAYGSSGLALGLGISGGLLAAGGIPMVIIGAKRHREHRETYGFAGVTPNVRVGRDGAVGGVTLRF